MGRQPDSLDKLLALATANGYKRGGIEKKMRTRAPMIMWRSPFMTKIALYAAT